MVFLYEVSYTPARTETLVVEDEYGKMTYSQLVAFYRVRYGVA